QAVGKLIMLHRLYVLREGHFEICGVDPSVSLPVCFLDPVNQWGTAVQISGHAEGPLTIRLEQCGKATARLADNNKKPLANIRAGAGFLNIVVTPGECHFSLKSNTIAADEESVINIDRHNYWDLPGSDVSGRITLPALIPGATYRLLGYEKNHFVVRKDFTVEPGETLELGDVVVREAK